MVKKLICFSFCILLCCLSCTKDGNSDEMGMSEEEYHALFSSVYHLNADVIRTEIHRLISQDSDRKLIDTALVSYYQHHGKMIWIDRIGVDKRADTLLMVLKESSRHGINPQLFNLHLIEQDLQQVRNLQVDTTQTTYNKIYARIEYRLTKAFLRYSVGLHFGFVNPNKIFNTLDIREQDSIKTIYRGLYDIAIEHPTYAFSQQALQEARSHRLYSFLQKIQPSGKLYHALVDRLAHTPMSSPRRWLLLVNMERARWQLKEKPSQYSKYLWVNLPSYQVRAVDGEEQLVMRMICGKNETKTPLLTSHIKRMDLNPQWIVPTSIVKQDMIHHVGDSVYFASRRFFAQEKNTGKRISPHRLSDEQLTSGNYFLIQAGGEGNALGRIVFRFDNKFAVFMHDTSSRDLFSSDQRGMSHGCVRVELPGDLAFFLLDKDRQTDEMRAKLDYTMSLDKDMKGNTPDGKEKKPEWQLRSVYLKPSIPLFFTYYTLYFDEHGQLSTYPDIYGYDDVLKNHLQYFCL